MIHSPKTISLTRTSISLIPRFLHSFIPVFARQNGKRVKFKLGRTSNPRAGKGLRACQFLKRLAARLHQRLPSRVADDSTCHPKIPNADSFPSVVGPYLFVQIWRKNSPKLLHIVMLFHVQDIHGSTLLVLLCLITPERGHNRSTARLAKFRQQLTATATVSRKCASSSVDFKYTAQHTPTAPLIRSCYRQQHHQQWP